MLFKKIKVVGLLVLACSLAFFKAIAQPTYTHMGNQTVQQVNGPATVTTISGWASGINAVTPQFNISNINVTQSLAFNVTPAVDAVSGDLTFTLTPYTSGEATFNIELEDLNDGQKSLTSTIKITVEFINSAPTFNATNTNLVYDEKAGPVTINGWATNISPGKNPLENNQKLTFTTTIVSQSANISFNAFPNVDEFGNFSFELTDKANGTIALKVYLEDDGSNTSPHTNKSTELDVTLTINPINDAPTFTKGTNIIIDEHNGPFTQSNWATQISAGAPDEDASQQLNFILTLKETGGNLQFDMPPTLNASGDLSFTATPHYNGYAVYEVVLQDDGVNSPQPNENTSAVQAFTITVNYINDPPSFDIGPDLVVDEGDVVYTFDNWATNISKGPSPNEQSQKLVFTVNFVQVTGTLAFLVAPQIDTLGTLSFRTTEHTHGEAIFEVFLSDDGDVTPPHNNTSDPVQFKITVNPVNFPPNDINLSNREVLEKQSPGIEVGQFTTSDLDPEDTHNYALVAGDGSEGNDFFTIEGDKLLTATTFNWDEAQSYSIRVKTSDGEFSLEKNFEITILKLIEGIKFANAITPNGDGQNDTWEIEDIDAFPDALVHVYDKAGLTVYQSSGGYTAWDGTANGKPLPMGTYYYVIDLRDGSPIYQGTITIIL